MADTEIHTTTDLMAAAAEALADRDTGELFRLMGIARDWLQPQTETDAQLAMLEAMAEAAFALADYEQGGIEDDGDD